MPFAPRIQRDILHALDQCIIPILRTQYVPLGYVAPPLEFSEGIQAKFLTSAVPPQNNAPPSFLNNGYWPEAKLHATVHPYLSFIYEGQATEHTLVHKHQTREYQREQGIYALQATSPSVLYFPPGTPRNGGKISFLEKEHLSQFPKVKILEIALLDPVLIHTHIETPSCNEVSHSLQIADPALLMLAKLLAEEMQSAIELRQDTAQAALLTFMLRLRHQLLSSPPHLANTSIPPPANLPPSTNCKDAIYQRAVYFIQTRLHEKLSVSQIANELDISPAQLNRYFRKFAGMSTMNYAQKQRIEAAKRILIKGSENIEEIALLLGYRYSAAFRVAFRKETGISPLKFRQKMRLK